ncbi:hypothetical protein TcWFU_007648 [Taenia crassiceps]|uniref:Uncharacterized protein n=1 Tax=Taenia crassiceps TaxID=6207 RepID=A0ABR4QBI4_9CEST
MVPSGLIISPASDITEVADSPFHYQRFPPHCSTSTFPKWSPQATFWSQSVLKHQRSLAASKGVSLHFMTGVEVGVEVGVEAGVTKVLVKRAKHWLHAHASCQPLYAHAPPRRRSQSRSNSICNKVRICCVSDALDNFPVITFSFPLLSNSVFWKIEAS